MSFIVSVVEHNNSIQRWVLFWIAKYMKITHLFVGTIGVEALAISPHAQTYAHMKLLNRFDLESSSRVDRLVYRHRLCGAITWMTILW